MLLELCDFDELFLEASYSWLQDEELRILIDSKPVVRQSQIQWFESIKNDKNYFIRGIKGDRIPIGVMGIKNIVRDTGEYWGYIGEKSFWGIGIGKWMMMSAFDICRSICIKRLYLRVLSSNQRAIKLYEKFGFVQYDYLDDMIYMEKFLS